MRVRARARARVIRAIKGYRGYRVLRVLRVLRVRDDRYECGEDLVGKASAVQDVLVEAEHRGEHHVQAHPDPRPRIEGEEGHRECLGQVVEHLVTVGVGVGVGVGVKARARVRIGLGSVSGSGLWSTAVNARTGPVPPLIIIGWPPTSE